MNDLGDDLLRFKKNQKYLIFDTETENLSLLPGNNRPWQLSFGIYQNGKMIEIYDRFLWFKDLKLSDGAALVTRFNWNSYKEKAEDPAKVLDHFDSFLYDENIESVGHNNFGFDNYIHNSLRRLLGRPTDYSYLARSHDTQNLYKAKEKKIKIDKKNYILWNSKMTNFYEKGFKTNLGHCCREMGIEVDPDKQHDGKYDIGLTGQLFQKMIWAVEV